MISLIGFAIAILSAFVSSLFKLENNRNILLSIVFILFYIAGILVGVFILV